MLGANGEHKIIFGWSGSVARPVWLPVETVWSSTVRVTGMSIYRALVFTCSRVGAQRSRLAPARTAVVGGDHWCRGRARRCGGRGVAVRGGARCSTGCLVQLSRPFCRGRPPRLRATSADHPDARQCVVAHSHRGNITAHAVERQDAPDVDGVVTLATPFIHARARNPLMLGLLAISGPLFLQAAMRVAGTGTVIGRLTVNHLGTAGAPGPPIEP
jgi:hypothetical protein